MEAAFELFRTFEKGTLYVAYLEGKSNDPRHIWNLNKVYGTPPQQPAPSEHQIWRLGVLVIFNLTGICYPLGWFVPFIMSLTLW